MKDIVNQSPYLRTSREFPNSIQNLQIELDRAYVDIAGSVNDRVIGIYPTNKSAVTGESWFLTSQRQQTIRKVFVITSTAAFNHYINFISPGDVTISYGTYTDGTNNYGLIYASDKALSGQWSYYITPTQIILLSAGSYPTFQSGRIVVEWLANNPNPN
jgi:hypothetical protein